ncbi:hypothetical protein LJC34_08150, partial [Oscillospiraceae bacterium OttesenSCG-928-G22]|nr:hypothetical protein [Oscillospiraceae bacterium OttesenSCG-928-G22]
FKYANNFNPCAFIAYIAGFIAGILWLDWAFLASIVVGGIVYFLTMRFWGAKKYGQKDICARFNIQ